MDRRQFFRRAGVNLSAMALAWCAAPGARSGERARRIAASDPAAAGDPIANPLAPQPPRLAAARAVIFLNMAGAPPQLDMFDHKPELARWNNTRVPASLTNGERFAFVTGDAKLLGPLYPFKQRGRSGLWMSTVTEPLDAIADDICMLHGVHTDQFNHAPAELKLFTGFPRAGRPSLGAWVTYGLGCASDSLPAFVVLSSGRGARCGGDCFGAGFLPSVHQGAPLEAGREPVLYLNDPPGAPRALRRATLDAARAINERDFAETGDPEIATRVAQYEMAFRMQAAAPELADFSSETAEALAFYGARPGEKSFANNCLLARRLIERGVRFVQLNHGEWDFHGGGRINIPRDCPLRCGETMRPTAALVLDLKRRGLLDEVVVVWGGEFGRTPMLQGEVGPEVGRDHHKTFSMWLAGGGVKGGIVHGGSDELGYHPLPGSLNVHDVQATLLRLLGLDHERLTYRFQGRQYRLTDIHGVVCEEILA